MWVALFLKISMLFILSVNTMFVMDEFWQFGRAKHLFDEFFHTVWPGKAVGSNIFYKLSHWIGWDAQSMLLAGRLQTALLSCATTYVVYRVARSLGEPVVHATLIILIMLCFSTFIERSFRLRSEPLAVFFAAAALWACVGREKLSWPLLFLAGILSGFSFLATQKAAYFNFALGMALVVSALLNRNVRSAILRGSLLIFGWTLPVIFYCLVFRPDNPLLIAENLVYGPMDVAMTGHEFYPDLRIFVSQTIVRNLPLYALCGLGLIISIIRLPKLANRQKIAAVFTLTVSALIFSHSQPWPYVFVMAIPFLALWGPVPVRLMAKKPIAKSLLLVCGGAVIVLSFVRNIQYLSHDNGRQFTLMRQVEQLLDPSETYFDGSGMLPNRRQSVEHFLDARWVWLTNSEVKNSAVYRELVASPPKVLIDSYRLTAVRESLAPLIRDRYIGIAPNIRIAGRKIDPTRSQVFDVPVAGAYRLYGKDGIPQPDPLIVNGFRQDPPFQLSRSKKTILSGAGTVLYLLPDNLPFAPLPGSYAVGPVYYEVYRF